LPFGKGKQYLTAANRLEDLIIGGYQVSTVLNWSAACRSGLLQQHSKTFLAARRIPSASGKMKTSLGGFNAAAKKRKFYDQQILARHCRLHISHGNG